MKSVVVTGVSSGIGKAVAVDLLGAGYRVFGSVRKLADGERLSEELGPGFVPLLFDVTNTGAIRRAAAEVERHLDEGEALVGLVNNAGAAAGAGPLLHADLAEVRQQMEINLIGLLAVTQAFAPLLGARRPGPPQPGRIVNISSVGGRMAAPFIGAYAASKHAVEGLSDSLRRELMLYGIDVVVVQPGAVKTAIWDKAEEMDTSAFAGTDYAAAIEKFREEFIARGRRGLEPEAIAAIVRRALEASRPRHRYTALRGRLANWTIPRLLPVRMVDRAISRLFGLHR